ncbi:MAG: ABC transporter permease [Anaerolineae bacterium]|nr:ABC transporter permease [Anaerolineae bacterium]
MSNNQTVSPVPMDAPAAIPNKSTATPDRVLYDFILAWRNLKDQPVQSGITLLVVALAIALFVTVVALNNGVRTGIIAASDPFGMLVVGPKGSSQELVMSTILLQGLPIGNMPYHIYEDLQQDDRVSLAVPLALGDNVGGARIIGTSPDFFQLRPALNKPPTFQLAAGREFNGPFEAVLGSKAAVGLGLNLGDQFVPAHGVETGLESDTHHVPHTIVGILQPTHSPFDSAVLTSIESVWAVHDEHAEADEHAEVDEQAEADEHAEDETADHREITAVLVRPTGFIETNQLWREFRLGSEAQAAFPGQELGRLFDLLNQGQQVLTVVGYLAAAMATLTVLLAIYSATDRRRQMIAVMRSLGANRTSIFRMVMFEALLIAALGAFVGRLLGYGAAYGLAANLTQQSSIPIPITYEMALEPWLWAIALAVGFVAGLIPALMAYRVNIVENL